MTGFESRLVSEPESGFGSHGSTDVPDHGRASAWGWLSGATAWSGVNAKGQW